VIAIAAGVVLGAGFGEAPARR
jgi:hypothetical protein